MCFLPSSAFPQDSEKQSSSSHTQKRQILSYLEKQRLMRCDPTTVSFLLCIPTQDLEKESSSSHTQKTQILSKLDKLRAGGPQPMATN